MHSGHYNLFSFCHDLCGNSGKVVVAIDSSKKIKETKGDIKNLFSEEERANQILSLKRYENGIAKQLVHEVHVFDTNEELFELINHMKPDVIVKGSDWKNQYVIGSTFFPVKYFEVENEMSSTKIIERIRGKLI